MKYKNIRWILKKQIEKSVKELWTWDRNENNFKCIYLQYTDELPIYTPQQLLDLLNEEEVKPKKNSTETG